MKYVVFGVPGVGKTSVVKEVVSRLNLTHIHWGDLSKEVALKQGLINEVDELRKLDLKQQLQIKELVVQEILNVAKQTDGELIIETHAAIKTPQGFLPGLEMKTIKSLDPDVFIVVEADPELVFQRRLLDKERSRNDDVTIKEVRESLRVTRQMAMTYAVLSSGTVLFVENKENELEFAVDKITKLIKQGLVYQEGLGAI